VKKTKSAKGSGDKGTIGNARKPGRIPVRGAKSGAKAGAKTSAKASAKTKTKGKGHGGGVGDRAALPPPRAPRADLGETRALAMAAIEAALEKKALAPVLIDVSAMASYTDFIGVVSGRSDRQVDAIAESIRMAMKDRGRQALGQEGTGNGRWTLLDFGSVVIHVFYHPVREFYDLESLWIEAPRVPLSIPAESTISEPESYYGAL
jgi:ribosome-associated protein